MYTSFIVLAMLGAPVNNAAPSWQSYTQASQMVEREMKPVAVFLGTGQKGWEKVAGSLGAEAEKVLSASYLCAYVDTDTPEGEKLAKAFEIKSGVGVVLSDRKGEKQAFWHEGTMQQTNLVRQLVRFSTTSRTSMYPADSTVLGTTSTFMEGGSSYCPSCNAGVSVRRR